MATIYANTPNPRPTHLPMRLRISYVKQWAVLLPAHNQAWSSSAGRTSWMKVAR
ncbi:guanine nucleotide-binding protein subunit alpha [Moniliophthora roreri]|nr:guanine nucleotide-binding protein subunit alpha [Moniliophthora roreri]